MLQSYDVQTAVKIEGLVKRYGDVIAVDGVWLSVEAGEILGLLGRNGAGKTTTLECVIGLRRPDAGKITVAGIDAVREAARARRKIGVQLQATALQDKITPRQALGLFAAFYPALADIGELLRRFGLEEKRDAAFDTLSGGQKQRLALALALVNRPEIVFLDEPTAGLDAEARRELHDLIVGIKSAGHTVVLTTHDIAEAEKLCDRIAIIDRGRIVAAGSPEELIGASRAQPVVIVQANPRMSDAEALSLPGAAGVQWRGERIWIATKSVTATITGVARLLSERGGELFDIQIHRPSLEDVFLEMLGNSAAPAAGAANYDREGAVLAAGTEDGSLPDGRGSDVGANLRGLWRHFLLTLRLNLRSRQALIYGYVVPVLFLIAFGAIFRSGSPPLLPELGQLLTITILGGACFGMPTAMVAERERGVWRRYRLLPAATGTLVISTMAARYLIVLSAALLQIGLAALMYGMPMPVHPLQMIPAFTAVTFAFLGMGLVIGMLADNVPAVQALGQAIFLPMIMIGGVGVPLWTLPGWAQHVAGFLPGKYAVGVLQACAVGAGVAGFGGSGAGTVFDVMALLAIGAAAYVAGGKMFCWDMHEKVAAGKRGWAVVAVVMWLSVGVAAEMTGQALVIPGGQSAAAALPAATRSAPGGEPYEAITRQQIDALQYNDLPWDDGTVTPVAKGLEGLNPERLARAQEIRRELDDWPPGKDPSLTQRVLNLLYVASVADIQKDEYEGIFGYLVFEKLKRDVPREELEKVLTWIILEYPHYPHVIRSVPELGVEGEAPAEDMPDRVRVYALKLMGRLEGKLQ